MYYFTVLFHRKKKERTITKIQGKHIENLFLLFVVIAREHVDTKSTQGRLAREHVSTQDTLARKERNLADSYFRKRDIFTSLFLQLRVFTCANLSLEELKEEVNEAIFKL